MGRIRFRSATENDANRVAEIMHASPGREAVAMVGGEAQARRFGCALTTYQGRVLGWDRTVLAESDGVVVGVLQWRLGSEPGLSLTPALAWAAFRALGVRGAARAALGERARRSVNPTPPPAALHIEELHVESQQRNSGIGGGLLLHAETIAESTAITCLSIITHTANPAQRLYRRCGFEVMQRREHPSYERITGIAGRVLMVKPLSQQAAV